MSKCNAEAVDVVFRMMFETLWVPPYDQRRGNPLLLDFERGARRLSILLSTTDCATASAMQLNELGEAFAGLVRCVERLAQARLFSAAECSAALEQARRIEAALPAVCGV